MSTLAGGIAIEDRSVDFVDMRITCGRIAHRGFRGQNFGLDVAGQLSFAGLWTPLSHQMGASV
jgi:hypothetical protein